MRLMLVEVVTPSRIVFSSEARMVSARAVDGEIGILPGHIPLVTLLSPGVVRIKDGSGGVTRMAVGGGFMEVDHSSKVTILAETAELSDEIDVERAKKARDRAEGRLLARGNPEIDAIRAEIALRRAQARLEAASKQ